MKHIPINRPAYLEGLRKADLADSLVTPTFCADQLRLKKSEFFTALKEGFLPVYVIADRQFVCPREIHSALQLLKNIQKSTK